MEARYLKEELERLFHRTDSIKQQDASSSEGGNDGDLVFLDSDNLRDLRSLLEHASKCAQSNKLP